MVRPPVSEGSASGLGFFPGGKEITKDAMDAPLYTSVVAGSDGF